jgi:hypothetical protein
MNKYEQLIEFIINEQEDKARELFHQIVVEKSREIYENLIDEEGFDQVGVAVDEVAAEDEMGMAEAGDDDMDPAMGDMGGDDMEMDADMGDDMGGDMDADMGDEMGGEGELEDRVMDLEAALDELKAEFDALMADEEGEPEHSDGESDPDFGGAEEPKEESVDPNMVREYVDKVATPGNAEGQTVGAQSSSKPTVNTKSMPGPGVNMGGSNANIVKGGTEQAADGKPTPKPSNQYTKGQGQVKHAGNFENVPGAKTKGYTDKHTSYEKQHGDEGQTTGQKMPVDKKAFIGTTVRNK